MVDVAFGATAMASIFAIVDPLGVVPFFSVLTEDMTPAEKRDVIARSCLVAVTTLGVFAVFGQFIFAGILVAVLTTFFLLHYADVVFRRIGRTGVHALGRIMGLLLAAIAVEFIIDGAIAAARLNGLLA